MKILTLTSASYEASVPVYVVVEHITCISRDGYNRTAVALTSGGCVFVREAPDTVLGLMGV